MLFLRRLFHDALPFLVAFSFAGCQPVVSAPVVPVSTAGPADTTPALTSPPTMPDLLWHPTVHTVTLTVQSTTQDTVTTDSRTRSLLVMMEPSVQSNDTISLLVSVSPTDTLTTSTTAPSWLVLTSRQGRFTTVTRSPECLAADPLSPLIVRLLSPRIISQPGQVDTLTYTTCLGSQTMGRAIIELNWNRPDTAQPSVQTQHVSFQGSLVSGPTKLFPMMLNGRLRGEAIIHTAAADGSVQNMDASFTTSVHTSSSTRSQQVVQRIQTTAVLVQDR